MSCCGFQGAFRRGLLGMPYHFIPVVYCWPALHRFLFRCDLFNIYEESWAGEYISVVKNLPRMHKVLGSIPNPANTSQKLILFGSSGCLNR